MLYQPSTAELEAESTAARFAFFNVRKDSHVTPYVLHHIRQAIAEVDLPEDASIHLHVSYIAEGNGGCSASVDLRARTRAGIDFTSVADDRHVLTLSMLGINRETASRVRSILCSSPILETPAPL